MARVVGEVGVHLEHVLVVALQRPLEPGDVGRAKAHLARAMEDVDSGVGARELIGDHAGPVGRVVVDDQHVEPRVLLQNLRHDLGQVHRFVVRRDDDQRPFSALRHSASPLSTAGPRIP